MLHCNTGAALNKAGYTVSPPVVKETRQGAFGGEAAVRLKAAEAAWQGCERDVDNVFDTCE